MSQVLQSHVDSFSTFEVASFKPLCKPSRPPNNCKGMYVSIIKIRVVLKISEYGHHFVVFCIIFQDVSVVDESPMKLSPLGKIKTNSCHFNYLHLLALVSLLIQSGLAYVIGVFRIFLKL